MVKEGVNCNGRRRSTKQTADQLAQLGGLYGISINGITINGITIMNENTQSAFD